MNPWLATLLGAGFLPHGHCYLWTPSMVWTQVSSNLLIGLAYVSIATTLAVLVRRIQNIPFAWVYVSFGVFILSCGLTHFVDVITVWRPIYWIDAAVRVITALASVATALLILPMLPQAQALAETARLSHDRKQKLEGALADLEAAHRALGRREAEAQRRAASSEEQFRTLVETMPQLTWISAPDGKTIYRNARWSQYTGLSLEELEARGWQSVHDPELVANFEAQFERALQTGEVFDLESRLRGVDGELRWFIARAVPVRDESGAITRWVGTCTDIHAQRMLREQALHSARMKDEFLATVSHELRTPLNAMLGWARMLRTGLLTDDKRDRAVEAIERNAVAQAQLIDDLLDISRIVSGKLRVEMSLIDPSEPIRAALDAVRPAALAKQVQLSAEISADAGPVIADGARLQQIAWNLLANALKFTPEGGSVALQLARVGGQVAIRVSDTGMGISAEFLPRVFDRFSQQDGSIRRKQGGLGIGLAIVKNLVELHGGSVQAASDGEGRGATFSVHLPLAAVSRDLSDIWPGTGSTQASAAFARPAELQGLRVLLVEDKPDSSELISALLARCGVEVTAAANAEQALALLRQDARFDLILSDIGLPGQDGYAFIQTVRNEAAWAHLPAAAITAYALASDRSRALSAGYQMHVPKPVEPAELIAVVVNLARIGAVMGA